jgi:uncharacterized protein (DUF433 family)
LAAAEFSRDFAVALGSSCTQLPAMVADNPDEDLEAESRLRRSRRPEEAMCNIREAIGFRLETLSTDQRAELLSREILTTSVEVKVCLTDSFQQYIVTMIDNSIHEAAGGLVVSNPAVLGGKPVFRGTRVPVSTLFEYLADGLSLDYFLESFPSITREQAVGVLRYGQRRIEDELAA